MFKSGSDECGTSAWLPGHLAALNEEAVPAIPLVSRADIQDVLPGFQLWDCWPLETPEGKTATIAGGILWVIMCAPRTLHPDWRHDHARLRLVLERQGAWLDCGHLLPDGLNPGSREWAGSTIFDRASGKVTLFYTAAGRRGEPVCTVEQRLFQTTGTLDLTGEVPRISGWSEPVESVAADGVHYVVVDQRAVKQGPESNGFIKGFRDSFFFRDPADGADYLLFTASCAASDHAFNGVIGLARAQGPSCTNWHLLPPVISATGLNNELERPVLRVRNGLYYLFWSTQRKTFAPNGPAGPNGLYGMVAQGLAGPWQPLNGTGLVAPNPVAEPFQTYSWWVMDNLEVAGFVDLMGLDGQSPHDDPALVQKHFAGVPAPRFRLALDGQTARVLVPDR